MTEDEARTKWCPFARCLTTIDNDGNPIALTAINRAAGDVAGSLCIASACMAWRFTDYFNEQHRLTRKVTIEPAPDGWSETNREGHCGLAGRPEQ
jgi:hypothetical protein